MHVQAGYKSIIPSRFVKKLLLYILFSTTTILTINRSSHICTGLRKILMILFTSFFLFISIFRELHPYPRRTIFPLLFPPFFYRALCYHNCQVTSCLSEIWTKGGEEKENLSSPHLLLLLATTILPFSHPLPSALSLAPVPSCLRPGLPRATIHKTCAGLSISIASYSELSFFSSLW